MYLPWVTLADNPNQVRGAAGAAPRSPFDLEQIATATIDVGSVLTQCGARAQVVRTGCRLVAVGLGAERVETRPGYASIDVTIGRGDNSVTRMGTVGPIGVNHRLDQAVRRLARDAAALTPATLVGELARLEADTPRHPPWFTAIAVGLACAAFGKLIGIDWPAFPAVFAAAAIGQIVRHRLVEWSINVFVVAVVVAFVAASLAAIGAAFLGSGSVYMAMIAAILLLIPGVPALNAQTDTIEGEPALGSARAVSVAMLLFFVVAGLAIAQALTGVQS
jgi:uncharacterized membrane protein YjjP (DUF1212 family)